MGCYRYVGTHLELVAQNVTSSGRQLRHFSHNFVKMYTHKQNLTFSCCKEPVFLSCYKHTYSANTAARARPTTETADRDAMLRAPLLHVLVDDAVIWVTSVLPTNTDGKSAFIKGNT